MRNEIADIIKWDTEHRIPYRDTAKKIIQHLDSRHYVEALGLMIPLSRIQHIDLNRLPDGEVLIRLTNGEEMIAQEFEAYRIAMESRNLEGKAMRWVRNAWLWHNLIAHPVMQILVLLGFRKLAMKIHDDTSPKPISVKKPRKMIDPDSNVL